jgi:hypothetical protein
VKLYLIISLALLTSWSRLSANIVIQNCQCITKLKVDAQGLVYGVGSFTSIEGEPAPGLARWLADGTLDRSFQLPQPSGRVIDIACFRDGRLAVLQEVEGRREVRIRRADGTWDPNLQFSNLLARVSENGEIRYGAGNPIELHLTDTQQLLGSFFTAAPFYNGRATETHRLAEISNTGALIHPPPAFLNCGTQPKVFPNGEIFIFPNLYRLDGSLIQSYGHLDPNAYNLVARIGNQWLRARSQSPRMDRLNNDGSVDESFHFDPMATNYPRKVATDRSGFLYVIDGLNQRLMKN